jgi:DNA-binding response OmpR family regulator
MSLRGRRLLVVEDDYLIADELRDQLIALGADVIGPVPTLARAHQMIGAETAVDGAILDVNLGGEKVFPIADLLRERGIPFVFVTGYDKSAIPPAYVNIPLCEKPFVALELARALHLR